MTIHTTPLALVLLLRLLLLLLRLHSSSSSCILAPDLVLLFSSALLNSTSCFHVTVTNVTFRVDRRAVELISPHQFFSPIGCRTRRSRQETTRFCIQPCHLQALLLFSQPSASMHLTCLVHVKIRSSPSEVTEVSCTGICSSFTSCCREAITQSCELLS